MPASPPARATSATRSSTSAGVSSPSQPIPNTAASTGSAPPPQAAAGGHHHRVAQRARQSGLLAVRQRVTAHVEQHDQVAAQSSAARPIPAATWPRRGWGPPAWSARPGTRPCAPRRSAPRWPPRGSRRWPRARRGRAPARPRSRRRAAAPGAGSIGRRSQVTPPTTGRAPWWSRQDSATPSAPTTSPPPPIPSTSGRRVAARSASASVTGRRRGQRRDRVLVGGSSTPASVIMAPTSSAGVTSKAGFSAGRGRCGQDLGGVALLDRDVGARGRGRVDRGQWARPRRRAPRGGRPGRPAGRCRSCWPRRRWRRCGRRPRPPRSTSPRAIRPPALASVITRGGCPPGRAPRR